MPPFLRRLVDALYDQLEDLKIICDIYWEEVPPTKLIRLYVISGGFENLRFTERQSQVWRIVDNILLPPERIRISSILTLTEEEIGDDD